MQIVEELTKEEYKTLLSVLESYRQRMLLTNATSYIPGQYNNVVSILKKLEGKV